MLQVNKKSLFGELMFESRGVAFGGRFEGDQFGVRAGEQSAPTVVLRGVDLRRLFEQGDERVNFGQELSCNRLLTGLFRRSRQPIYLGFAMVLCSGPVWTLDHCVIASAWTTYCVLGPLLKERRFGTRYGADFEAYRRRVPYFFPQLHS